MKKLLTSAAFLLAITVTWPSASSAVDSQVDPVITSGEAARDFSVARARWRNSGISDYRFKITAGCFCPYVGPVKVTVHRRRKTVSNRQWFGPRSVPGLFQVVHDAIKRGAASLTVEYDTAIGRPRTIAIDYDRMIADEEIAYTIKGFRKLPAR